MLTHTPRDTPQVGLSVAPPIVSAMTKTKMAWSCGECGWNSPKWVGRCGECQAWGSVEEVVVAATGSRSVVPLRPAQSITTVDAACADRRRTGVGELDRVLGGGLVLGSTVLLAGEPGVGKSTLLLTAAARWAADHGPTLYISGEESAGQIRLRAQRTGASHDDLYVAAETDLASALGQIDQVRPGLVVVDSVQTLANADQDGAVGGTAQVKAVAGALSQVAKGRGLPVIVIGHVTKEGAIAGPRTLEHLVDVVLSFEGDPHSGLRLVRTVKNRFGPADEVGCFELTEEGIREVTDPAGIFTSHRGEPVSGTALAVTLEGRRPLLAEIQALVAPSSAQAPRRVANGLDGGRLAMILAVLDRRARVRLASSDVYASTVGGAKVSDPAADLALAVAIASAGRDEAVPARLVALGEVGLAGELRPVKDLDKRLGEAARLGVTQALIPAKAERSSRGRERWLAPVRRLGADGSEMAVVEVATVAEALAHLGLGRKARGEHSQEFGPVARWGHG